MMIKRLFYILLPILLICSLAFVFYYYQKASSVKTNPSVLEKKEAEDLVERVSKLIVLPEGEVPTVATVSDPDKLKDQPFFAKAKTGDKVLLYSVAKKAYLYDPSQNILLEVAPINIGSNNNAQAVQKAR